MWRLCIHCRYTPTYLIAYYPLPPPPPPSPPHAHTHSSPGKRTVWWWGCCGNDSMTVVKTGDMCTRWVLCSSVKIWSNKGERFWHAILTKMSNSQHNVHQHSHVYMYLLSTWYFYNSIFLFPCYTISHDIVRVLELCDIQATMMCFN